MIISGVLIWQTARGRSRYSDKQKIFHHRITKLNLTVCLGFFPAVAGIDILWLLTGCLSIWAATKITVDEDVDDPQEVEAKPKPQTSAV
jgi:hypothetical protein